MALPTDQGLPVPAARTPPGGALACAPGSGTLPPFAALTALIVRRVNSGVALFVRRVKGFADRPRPACAGRPHAPRRGIGVRTRQRHLAAVRGADRACCAPRKWPLGLLYCVKGFADRPRLACTGSPHAPRRGIGVRTRQRHLAAKKNLKLCAKQLEVKKFPAPCYSPIVNYTVPSPLEPLTTVFGKGTCVSAPLSAPEKITIKKISPGIISKIQSSRLPTSVESTFFSALHAEL